MLLLSAMQCCIVGVSVGGRKVGNGKERWSLGRRCLASVQDLSVGTEKGKLSINVVVDDRISQIWPAFVVSRPVVGRANGPRIRIKLVKPRD